MSALKCLLIVWWCAWVQQREHSLRDSASDRCSVFFCKKQALNFILGGYVVFVFPLVCRVIVQSLAKHPDKEQILQVLWVECDSHIIDVVVCDSRSSYCGAGASVSDHSRTRSNLHPPATPPGMGHHALLYHHGHHLPHGHLWPAGGLALASRSHKVRKVDRLHRKWVTCLMFESPKLFSSCLFDPPTTDMKVKCVLFFQHTSG